MSNKRRKIATLIESCQGQEMDAHYLGYFVCFNRGQFYESHEVLEELWLSARRGPNGAFYKGLIQFAGAFVHLQKHTPSRPRLGPAAALLRLARGNFQKYPPIHEQLDLSQVKRLIEEWLARLASEEFATNPLTPHNAPRLRLSTPR